MFFTFALLLFTYSFSFSSARAQEFFPVGVWYGGGKARAPMLARDPAAERDVWKKDLQTIKSLGFNSIKCWVDWATAEPRKGEYHFEALEQLLSLADEAGLRVIVQLYIDSAPEWLGETYKDASFVTDQGQAIGSQASPGFCIDHPGVREAMAQFITAAGRNAQKHRSFYAFDLWSEPHIVNWVWFNQPVEFCYCPYTQARFRDWLKHKYSTLDKLNQAWYRTFTNWQQVSPPRYGTILSYADFIDWKSFTVDKLQGDLKMKADAAHRADASFIVSSHSDAPAVLLSPLSGFGNPDDWLMSQVVNFYGTSIYPKHGSAQTPWSAVRLTAALDGIRSAAGEKGWWIGELQAGQGTTGVRVANPVTGDDLRLWGWTVISRGARSISYYAWYPMSSGYESNGYGMIELDGTITERAKVAGQFARVVNQNAALFDSMRPQPSQVAVVYNRLAYMTGGNTVGPGQTVRSSLLGFYRAMFERNIQVDFVHADEIAAGRANRYRVIYLPYPLMLSRPVAKALEAYVQRGGALISEARPAWNDEHGFANERIPGAGLDEVFGVREKLLLSPQTVEMTVEKYLHGNPLAPLSGRRIQGIVYAEHLETTSPAAKVLARFADGDPAIVLNRFGKGTAILIGSFPAAAYEQEHAAENAQLLQELTAWAGVEAAIRIDGAAGQVEARLLKSGDAFLLIAMNHSEAEQDATFKLEESFSRLRARDLETGEAASLTRNANGQVLFSHRFRPGDALVLLIK